MRPRHPNTIRLQRNNKGLYDIAEGGIVYSMPMELTSSIKTYFIYLNGSDKRTIVEWYKGLTKEDKKKVVRTGNLPGVDDGYYKQTD